MPSIEREVSRDSERRLSFQHSSSLSSNSDYGRALVPMWDSSDPERAPPPLPLNPGSPVASASRPNTSSAIQSAHAALAEKARESAYTTNPPPLKRPDISPDKSLVKGAAHKRMQSLQPGSVRDLSHFLESKDSSPSPTKSPGKSQSRPTTPRFSKDFALEGKSEDKSSEKTSTPSTARRDSLLDTPSLKQSLRRPHTSILGENSSPQSATMLALQSMPSRDSDTSLASVTNGSNAMMRSPQTFDAISNQILSLTSIATSLQREMAQLSRRSKDNATDLLSLKEATNSRDEDIRKSLRELVAGLSETDSRSSSTLYSSASLYLDNKPHNSPGSRGSKTFSLPRIPSPTSFAASLDRDSIASPQTLRPDSAASIALLEKILREMGTRDGQEHLVSRLTEVADRLSQDHISTSKKLEDLVQYIKENSGSNALIAHGNGGNGTTRGRKFSFNEGPQLELDFDQQRPGPMTERVNALLNKGINPNMQASGALNDEFVKAIRNVKDSVAQGGGLTAEVKALVRELRGEVLGMGRELGRKIEESNYKQDDKVSDPEADKEDMLRIVQNGLEDMRQHIDKILQDQHRQTSKSAALNTQEIASALKSVVAGVAMAQVASREKPLDKLDIIEAVREAWENYKPDIEVQTLGLERDELLSTLKEGFQEYAPNYDDRDSGATREEVFQAVVEGFKHFSPPRMETEASLSRDEILDAVRECLEEFEFPAAPPLPGGDLTRDDMVDAVKEGLSNFDFPVQDHSQDLVPAAISRDDVFEAVKAGFEASPIPTNSYSDQVLERLQDIMESMQQEFRAVSDEAKQNVAAHGRDTEQMLDATRDGLENLRSDIESYVDRVAGITEREDVLDGLQEHFDSLRAEIQVLANKSAGDNASETVQRELEHLRETMATSLVRGGSGIEKEEILDAFREGLDELRADIERPRNSGESVLSGTGEILDALHDGINELRADVEKIRSKPVDMTVSYEILDSLKTGLEAVRVEIEQLRESRHGEREVATITDGAVIPAEDIADNLKRNDIENLEVLITQLRIKVEALESMPPPIAEFPPGMLFKEDLIAMEETLHTMQATVADISSRETPANENAATKEDVEAIETLLRNTKAKIDNIDPEQTVKREHLDSVEAIIRDTKDAVNALTSQMSDASTYEHFEAVETLVKEVIVSLDEMKSRAADESADLEKVHKTDVEAVEAVCHDIKAQIEQMVLTDLATLATGDDLKNLVEMVKEFKDRIELHAETNAKQFEERQAETVGVGERVTEIKTYLEEFKDALKEKFDEGSAGIDSLGKLLENLSETVGQNASVPDDIKALFETMKTEFEKSNAGVVGVKLDSDEKFQKTWDKLDEKLEEKFAEIMTKYDDAQVAAEAKATAGEEKTAQGEAAVLSTKAVAEELKLLVDTLGTTLTDSIERMDEASKTVFSRVEDTFTRVEETHADAKAEHQLTREQVFKAHSVIESLQGHVNEHDPKVLQAVNDILLIVGQHFEHSKTSADSLRDKISEIPPPPELPMLPEIPVVEKYDDACVQEKLDNVFSKLTEHVQSDKETSEKLAKLEVLDRIHQQVMQTSMEVTNFVATQTKLITEDRQDKERELETTTIALEKQLTLKEHVEKEVSGLREEESLLRDSVMGLKAEKEDLTHQKMRLAADVSSLETALRIRREELHAMETRAEGLERRILEGVLDHSRALILSRSNKSRDAAMSLKRMPSNTASTHDSYVSGTNSANSSSTLTQSGINMALSGNRGLAHQPNSSSRRILSLSQIPNNAVNGGPKSGFKRSHSVKHPEKSISPRKTSWSGRELNKENLALKETEEESETESEGEDSDASTTRRTSGVGTESMVEGSDYSSEYTYSEGPTPMSEDANPMVLYQEESGLAA